jgi:uncharacterized protein
MEPDDKNSPSADPNPPSDSAQVTGPDRALEWPPHVETSSPLPWPIQSGDHGQRSPASPTPQLFASLAPPPGPEDLQVPWGWLDVLLLVAIGVLGTFAVSVLLVFGAGALGVSVARLRSSPIDQSIFLIVNQAVISVVLLVYLAAQMRLRFEAPFWRTIGWRKLDTGAAPHAIAYLGYIAVGFLFAVLVQLASAAVGTRAKLPIEIFFQDRRTALLLMLMSVLVAPVVEETIFRGYLYPVVARTFGITTGVFATGILFGLLHAQQLKGAWGQIGLLMVVGIVFTYARATKRSVVASYLLHLSYNSFLFIEFIIASGGFRHLPGQ